MSKTKWLAIVLFTFHLSATFTNSLIIDKLNFVHDDIDRYLHKSMCISKFVMELIEEREIYVFVNKSVYNHLPQEMSIKTLQLNIAKKVMVIETTTATPRCEELDLTPRKRYLMFVDSAEDLEMMLSKLLCIGHFSKSRLVVVKTNEPIQTPQEAEAYIDVIFKHGIDRASVLTTREPGVINYWRSKQRCKTTWGQTLLYYCDVKELQTLPYRYMNVFRCPVTVGVREVLPFAFYDRLQRDKTVASPVSGIEIKLIELFFKNISYVFGSYDELMEKLLDHEIVFMLGALPTPKDLNMAAAYPHDYAKMIAIVKRKSNNSVWGLFKTLSMNIWITFFCAQLVVILIMYVIVQYFNDKLSFPTIIFSFFAITVGKPLDIDRLTNLRLVFIYWSWLDFFIRSAFEACMVYAAIDNESKLQINNLDDLCSGSRQAYTRPEYKTYFEHGLTFSKCSIPKENFHYVEAPLNMLADSQEKDSDVLFLLDRHYRAIVAVHGKVDYDTLHVMKEHVFFCPLTFCYHQGLLVSEVLPVLTLRLQDMGLISAISKQLENYVNLAFYKRHSAPDVERYVMTMRQIQLVLMLYLWGVLVAVAVLITEIVVFKFKERHR